MFELPESKPTYDELLEENSKLKKRYEELNKDFAELFRLVVEHIDHKDELEDFLDKRK